jgi:hypothetical protein
MATFQDGGRKSALRFVSDDVLFGTACRWCDYENITIREFDDAAVNP